MIQLFGNPNYNFIGRRRWAYLASALFILIGLVSLVGKGGLRYDIDFAGGTLVQVRFEQAPRVEDIRQSLAGIGLETAIIQEFGDPREFIVRLPLGDKDSTEVGRQIQQALGASGTLGSFEIRRVEFVGPQVGRDLQLQAIYAVIVAAVGMLVYIALRFDLKGGVAAVVAVAHDVLVSVSALSLTDREFSLPVLAAILTIIGYSLNDKVVIFDRVRENLRKYKRMPMVELLDLSINETLSRSVLTHVTTFLAMLPFLFFGGEAIYGFALAMVFGIVITTYSSIFVASPMQLILGMKRDAFSAAPATSKERGAAAARA